MYFLEKELSPFWRAKWTKNKFTKSIRVFSKILGDPPSPDSALADPPTQLVNFEFWLVYQTPLNKKSSSGLYLNIFWVTCSWGWTHIEERNILTYGKWAYHELNPGRRDEGEISNNWAILMIFSRVQVSVAHAPFLRTWPKKFRVEIDIFKPTKKMGWIGIREIMLASEGDQTGPTQLELSTLYMLCMCKVYRNWKII